MLTTLIMIYALAKSVQKTVIEQSNYTASWTRTTHVSQSV